MKFRKKPVVIEAFQLYMKDGTHQAHPDWLKEAHFKNIVEIYSDYILIRTLEGVHRANHGDWIIKGVAGELYPCKPDIFEKTYEAVDAD